MLPHLFLIQMVHFSQKIVQREGIFINEEHPLVQNLIDHVAEDLKKLLVYESILITQKNA